MEENTPNISSPASDNIKNFILVSDLKFHGLSMILLSVWKLGCLGGLILYKSFMMRQLIGFLISKLNLSNWLFSYPWIRTNVNLLRSVWIDWLMEKTEPRNCIRPTVIILKVYWGWVVWFFLSNLVWKMLLDFDRVLNQMRNQHDVKVDYQIHSHT